MSSGHESSGGRVPNPTQSGDRFADLPQELHAYGFPRWKKPIVKQCFPGRKVRFVNRGEPLPKAGCLILWGMEASPVPDEEVQIARMEDGFLRSVGLGADIVRPASWVVDLQGLYYDATRPSELESLLENADFDPALCDRAARLRERVVEARLTKYNVGHRLWQRPAHARRVILVPGQVESDASIAYGAGELRGNMALLQTVRSAQPDAYVVYKPHPDVVARMRLEGHEEGRARLWCDEVVTDVPMAELLDAVDEVQVLTSLAGFEALLRGKSVVCHGRPFYSGWGLTQDRLKNPRRHRRLTLDELVAGALIRYPLYMSRDGKCLLSPEEALDELVKWKANSAGPEPWWQEIYRFFVRRIAGVR